jgi:hypothetical protein
MASLTEALGASALRAAYCDVTPTTRVVVRQEMNGLQLGGRMSYVVTAQRGAGLPQALGEASSAEEALSRIRALDRSAFDAERAEWQPATSASSSDSATWSDEAGPRTLPPTDNPQATAPRDHPDVPPEDVLDPYM